MISSRIAVSTLLPIGNPVTALLRTRSTVGGECTAGRVSG